MPHRRPSRSRRGARPRSRVSATTSSEAGAVEAIVVGAGPAGSIAALALARAGRRVLLLDARDFPRDKICGDLVGTEAVAALRRLGLEATLDGAIALGGAKLYAPSGRTAGRLGGDGSGDARAARVLPRSVFDGRLRAAALAAGARFDIARATGLLFDAGGRVAGVRTSAGVRAARVVVGADGYGSAVARALGASPRAGERIAVVVRAYAREVTRLGHAMHFFVNARRDGYGWVFPLAGGGANVGLGFITGEPGATDVRGAFARFVAADSPAAGLLRGATVERPAAWPIPLGWAAGPRAGRGVFLAGDAAGLASPLSGSGIHHAIRSGVLAAEAAASALDVDAPAGAAYDRRLVSAFAPRLRFEGLAHRLAGTPDRIEPWLALARAVPGAQTMLSRALLALG